MTETVPANTTFDAAASSAGWLCSPSGNAGSTCTLAVGSLNPNQSVTKTFAVTVVSPLPAGVTNISNTACSSTTTAGDPTANNCSTVTTPAQGSPALSLKKSLASGSGTPGSTCTLGLGTLAGGGASVSRTFAVVIDNPLPAGTTAVENSACAIGDPNLSSCNTVTVSTNGVPSLHLKKTLSSGTGAPGSLLVYSLAATNSGNQAAANLSLRETVPTYTTFVPGSSPARRSIRRSWPLPGSLSSRPTLAHL